MTSSSPTTPKSIGLPALHKVVSTYLREAVTSRYADAEYGERLGLFQDIVTKQTGHKVGSFPEIIDRLDEQARMTLTAFELHRAPEWAGKDPELGGAQQLLNEHRQSTVEDTAQVLAEQTGLVLQTPVAEAFMTIAAYLRRANLVGLTDSKTSLAVTDIAALQASRFDEISPWRGYASSVAAAAETLGHGIGFQPMPR